MPFKNLALSQDIKEDWQIIQSDKSGKEYINLSDLKNSKVDNICVWVKEEFASPIEIEGINEKIYQTKTYYQFNNQKKRYDILQMMFYDEDSNVLKSYTYSRKYSMYEYKYNTPILNGTNAELILNKCIEILSTQSN